VVGSAVLLSWGGREAVEAILSSDGWWTSERVLGLIAGILLTFYTIYLFYDWYMDDDDDDDEEEEAEEEDSAACEENALEGVTIHTETENKDDLRSSPRPSPPASPRNGPKAPPTSAMPPNPVKAEGLFPQSTSPSEEVAPEAAAESKDALGSREGGDASGSGNGIQTTEIEVKGAVAEVDVDRNVDTKPEPKGNDMRDGQSDEPTHLSLVTVALLGSLDDFSVFFGLLLAGTFSPWNLVIGVFIGSVLVVLICLFATLFAPVVWVLERIPLWVIIGIFTLWTFISIFVS